MFLKRKRSAEDDDDGEHTIQQKKSYSELVEFNPYLDKYYEEARNIQRVSTIIDMNTDSICLIVEYVTRNFTKGTELHEFDQAKLVEKFANNFTQWRKRARISLFFGFGIIIRRGSVEEEITLSG